MKKLPIKARGILTQILEEIELPCSIEKKVKYVTGVFLTLFEEHKLELSLPYDLIIVKQAIKERNCKFTPIVDEDSNPLWLIGDRIYIRKKEGV